MRSLPIFQNYLNIDNKFQGTLWEYEKPKVNVTQRSPWNSIYLTFSFERGVETSLLVLLVDQLMRVDYSPHSLQSFELSVVEVICQFYFMLVISKCRLLSYDVDNMDHFECKHLFVNYFLLACQIRDDCQANNKVSLITRLLILG